MSDTDKKAAGPDYSALAEGIDGLREVFAAMVAGLTADGFTDEQARAVLAGMFAAEYKKVAGSDDG